MDHYRSFNSDTQAAGTSTACPEFDTYCDDVKCSIIRNNAYHSRVREMALSSKCTPPNKKEHAGRCWLSPNMKHMVKVDPDNSKAALLYRFHFEKQAVSELGELFSSETEVQNVVFTDDGSFLLVYSQSKCDLILTNKKTLLSTFSRKETDGVAEVGEPAFTRSENFVLTVEHLANKSPTKEDTLWSYVDEGKLLLIDFKHSVSKSNPVKPSRRLIVLDKWAEFVGRRVVQEIKLVSPGLCLVLMKEDSSQQLYLLSCPCTPAKVSSEAVAVHEVGFEVLAHIAVEFEARLTSIQQNQVSRLNILMTETKENFREEVFAIQYDLVKKRFVRVELLKHLSKIPNKVIAAYGLKYLIAFDGHWFDSKKHRLIRVYRRNGAGEYGLIASLDPLHEKVACGQMDVFLTTDWRYLVAKYEKENENTAFGIVRVPILEVVMGSACLTKSKQLEGKKYSDNEEFEIEIFDLKCDFEGLKLEMKEPNYVIYQSTLEDFATMVLMSAEEPIQLLLLFPSNMLFFKMIKLNGSYFKEGEILFVTKIAGHEKLIVAYYLPNKEDQDTKRFVVIDAMTGEVLSPLADFESISSDGLQAFFFNQETSSVHMYNILEGWSHDLGIKDRARKYDSVGGKVVAWSKSSVSGPSRVHIYSLNPLGVHSDFHTLEEEDRGTPPIIARKRGLVLLILKREFVLVKVKSLKISRAPLPSDLDYGPSTEIDSVSMSWDEKLVSFIFNSESDCQVFSLKLESDFGLTFFRPTDNIKDILLVGGSQKYLMTKERSYRDLPTVLKFKPVSSEEFSTSFQISISRARSAGEATFGMKGKSRYLFSNDSVEFFRLENFYRTAAGNKEAVEPVSVLVKCSIPFCDPSKFGIEMILSEAREFFLTDSANKKRFHVDNILGIITMVQPQTLDLTDVFTVLVYHLDSQYAFDSYLSFLGLSQMVVKDRLLSIFYSDPKFTSGRQIIKAIKNHSEQAGSLSLNDLDQQMMKNLIFNKENPVVLDDLTKEILKMLLFSPTDIIVEGELADPKQTAVQLPAGLDAAGMNLQGQRSTLKRICKGLLVKQSNVINRYRIHETKLKLDLTNGSYFSLSIFEFVGRVPDPDIRDKYSILIYHKWSKIFAFAVWYSAVFWVLNILAALYLSDYIIKFELALVVCILNGLFLLFELKCLISDSQNYMSDMWNMVDASVHFFSIFSTVFVVTGSDGSGSRANDWLRLCVIVGMTVRSITLLKVFAPFRYLIRMMIRVFLDITPFLTILTIILLLWSLMWSLSPTLSNPHGPALSFYSSFQVAMSLMMFNVPESEADGSPLGAVKFWFVVLANLVIIVVLMNFLIAVISDTYAAISQNRTLYEAKELLSLIRDFDSFLVGTGISPVASEVRFAFLIPEPDAPSDQNESSNQLLIEKVDALHSKMEEISTTLLHLKRRFDDHPGFSPQLKPKKEKYE